MPLFEAIFSDMFLFLVNMHLKAVIVSCRKCTTALHCSLCSLTFHYKIKVTEIKPRSKLKSLFKTSHLSD